MSGVIKIVMAIVVREEGYPRRRPGPAAQRGRNRSDSASSSSSSGSSCFANDLFPGSTEAEDAELRRVQDVGRRWRLVVEQENAIKPFRKRFSLDLSRTSSKSSR